MNIQYLYTIAMDKLSEVVNNIWMKIPVEVTEVASHYVEIADEENDEQEFDIVDWMTW